MTTGTKELPVCVLAGSREQYEQWLDETGSTSADAVHVFDQRSLQANRFRRIQIVGNFWHRKDAGSFYQLACARTEKPKQPRAVLKELLSGRRDLAQPLLDALSDAGYAVVPKEPSDEILAAAGPPYGGAIPAEIGLVRRRAAWKKMLAAIKYDPEEGQR